MFCQNCGSNLDNNAAFCPNCGAAAPKAETAAPQPVVASPVATPAPEQTYTAPVEAPAPQQTYTAPQQTYSAPQQNYTAPQQVFTGYALNPVTARFNSVFSDVLFMIVCILVSVSTLFSSIQVSTNVWGGTSTSFSPDVFGILFTIFLWMTYSSAKKGNINIKSLRSTSGTTFAMYIVMWVAVGILGVCGLLVLVAGNAVGGSIMGSLVDELGSDAAIFYELGLGSAGAAFTFIAIVILLMAGVFAVFNIFFVGGLHKFAKSIYTSAQNGFENIVKANSCSIWLLVMGIINVLGSFSGGFTGFIAGAAQSATYIILFIWIKKYFVAPAQTFVAPPQNYVG